MLFEFILKLFSRELIFYSPGNLFINAQLFSTVNIKINYTQIHTIQISD